ncbi:MAG: prepilin-type N-terminal cleavage/methylation domain-containing protein [Patescibacteria group bacterium]
MKLKTKGSRGFTLIELLVVIAIISLLSSIVLASLSTARLKAKDASIKETMISLRSEAELGFASGGYAYSLCTEVDQGVVGFPSVQGTPGNLYNLILAIQNLTPNTVQCGQNTGSAHVLGRPTAWGAAVTLNDGTVFCVDSQAKAIISTVSATNEITASYGSVDVVCNNG